MGTQPLDIEKDKKMKIEDNVDTSSFPEKECNEKLKILQAKSKFPRLLKSIIRRQMMDEGMFFKMSIKTRLKNCTSWQAYK